MAARWSVISNQIGVAFGADATLGDVEDDLWKSIADTYAFNDGIWEQLDPSARQMISGWMLDAMRRGMWQASPEDMEEMANRYVENMAEFGNNCCQVTSDQNLNNWIAAKATVNKSVLDGFKENFYQATRQRLAETQVKITPISNSEQAVNQPVSPVLLEPTKPLQEATLPEAEIEEMPEQKEPAQPEAQITARELNVKKPDPIPIFWAGSIATFLIAALIVGIGFHRQWKKRG